MKLGDYLDELENNGNSMYEMINVYPFNHYEIKDFIKIDLTLSNKQLNSGISDLVKSKRDEDLPQYYHKENKDIILYLLKHSNFDSGLLTKEFEKYFKSGNTIKSSDSLLDMLDDSYTNAKKVEYLNILKDLQSDLKEQIEEANKLLS